MYKNKTFLAVIPARGGSKGIPNKNIIEINGKPLIQYTIDAALGAKYLDRVVVSTESKKIADVARKCGADVPFLRPVEIASDTSKIVDTLIHVISELKKYGEKYDYVVLLQPTQPLRQAFHIDEAIKNIVNNDKKSLVSVSKVKEHPILMRTIDNDNTLKNLLSVNSTIRRQDFPDYYKINGAIYINKIDKTIDVNLSLNDNKFPYIMEEKYDVDIDTFLDLEVFRIKLEKITNK